MYRSFTGYPEPERGKVWAEDGSGGKSSTGDWSGTSRGGRAGGPEAW